jgi:hypothetical protein
MLSFERRFGFLLFFGLMGAAVAGGLKAWPLPLAVGLGAAAVLVAAAALFRPTLLEPLAEIWRGIGVGLGRVVNPIVLGILFFGVIAPLGFVARAFGYDPLRLKRRAAGSFWVPRASPGPSSPAFFDRPF